QRCGESETHGSTGTGSGNGGTAGSGNGSGGREMDGLGFQGPGHALAEAGTDGGGELASHRLADEMVVSPPSLQVSVLPQLMQGLLQLPRLQLVVYEHRYPFGNSAVHGHDLFIHGKHGAQSSNGLSLLLIASRARKMRER